MSYPTFTAPTTLKPSILIRMMSPIANAANAMMPCGATSHDER